MDFSERRWVAKVLAFAMSVQFGLLPACGHAAAIDWDGKRLSIHDASGALVDVLDEVALTLGSGLTIHGDPGEVLASSVPSGEPGAVLRELVRPNSLIIRYDGATGLPRQIIVREAGPGDGSGVGGIMGRSAGTMVVAPPLVADVPGPDDEAFKERLRLRVRQGGPEATREIARMSASSEARPEMRRLALVALSRMGGSEALSAMRNALHDARPSVRLQAARGLERLLREQAQGDLKAAIRKEPAESVREAMQRMVDRAS